MSEITGTGTENAGAEPQATAGKTYTQEEFDAATTRARKAAESKAAKLEAELASAREAQKSEAEKMLDKVRTETAAEWASKLQQQTIRAELKVKLLERGLPSNALHVVTAEHEISSVEEIEDAIESTLKTNEWLKPGKSAPAHSGQGGTPRSGPIGDDLGPPWTGEKIRRARETGQFGKHRKSIEAAIAGGKILP